MVILEGVHNMYVHRNVNTLSHTRIFGISETVHVVFPCSNYGATHTAFCDVGCKVLFQDGPLRL